MKQDIQSEMAKRMDYLIACARDLVCGRRYARQTASSWRAPTIDLNKETQKRSLVDKSIRLSIGLGGVPINTTHYFPPLNLRRWLAKATVTTYRTQIS